MASHPTVPPSLLADVFESLVAALYLDGGDAAAPAFIQRHVDAEIRHAVEEGIGGNYKSLLQQHVQRDSGTTPTYQLVDETRPRPLEDFKIAAKINDRRFSPAWGRNKKEAEQRAAATALAELSNLPVPYPTD